MLISCVVPGCRHCASVSILGCVCVLCTCVCVPFHLNPSHVPPQSRMGQQVSRSLARALPVLFWTSWLHWRGCQSSQPFPPIHPAEPQPLPPRLHLLVHMMWTNTVYWPLRCAGCIFHHHFSTFTLVVCVSQLVADAAGRLSLKVCSLPLVSPLIRRLHLFYPYQKVPSVSFFSPVHVQPIDTVCNVIFILGWCSCPSLPLSGAAQSIFKATKSRDRRRTSQPTWPSHLWK